VIKTAIRAPNQNAFVERWVQSIKHEVLDHFIVIGEDHFNHLISEYVEHYLTERPHQGIDNELITRHRTAELSDKPPDCKILCHERLGGVLKHYYRAAA
jgi:putative transposase